MESKLFLEKLRSQHTCEVVSKLSYFGLTWNQWAKFAEMTRSLDYGCNFNIDGKTCKKGIYFGSVKEMCCCGCCRSQGGYIKLIPNDEKIIKEIASLFDKEFGGFWRKSKGCILPAKYRSDTCIAYRCYEAREQRNKEISRIDGFGAESFEQMALYFLDTLRSATLSNTQVRIIIKELIKI